MYPAESHGRLGYLKILGIFLLAVAGAAVLGASLSPVLGLSASSEMEQTTRQEEARRQNLSLAENFRHALETIRVRALSLRELRATPSGPILHWAELEVRGDVIYSVKQAARNPKWKLPTTASGLEAVTFEESFLKDALSFLNLQEIRREGAGVLEVREDRGRNPRFLGFAFLAAPESVVLALVDPMEAFPIFAASSSPSGGPFFRAYLMGPGGNVLAHSYSSVSNADFSSLPVYVSALRSALGSSAPDQTSGVSVLQAIDKLSAITAWSRIGRMPLGLVVERVEFAPETGTWTILAAALPVFGVLVILAAFVLGYGRLVASRKGGHVDIPLQTPVMNPALEIRAIPMGEDVNNYVEKYVEESGIRQELLASQRLLNKEREENVLIDRFEMEAARIADPRIISERMVSVAARICKSPVLWFNHQESTKLGILAADAGFQPGDVPGSMTFPITAEVTSRMQEAESNGQQLSLTEYPPLSRAIMNRMGVAHFEAWPVSSRGRLLGVLVILQAGIDSDKHRDSLGRMMRTAGLIHENAKNLR